MTITAPTAAGAPAGRPARGLGRLHAARGLAVNGGALVANVLASGLTGLGFWVLAARVAPPAVVAQASTAIAAILAVVSLSQQSFVLTLPALLADAPEPRRMTLSVYRAALLMTALVAPTYVVLGPRLAHGLQFLQGWRSSVAFVIAALVWCLFSLQDAVLTGLRKATYVLAENTGWGTVRVVLLVAALAGGVHMSVVALVASWVVPAAACVALVSWYLFAAPSSPLAEARGSRRFERRQLLGYMGAEYVTSVLGSAVTLVTGAYALTTLGATEAAPLMLAASLVLVVEGAVSAFAQSLAVEASRADGAAERRRSLVHLTVLALGGLSLGAVVTVRVASEPIMGLLGSHYREAGGAALMILVLAVPARAVSLVSNADNRIRGEGGRNLLQQALACAVCFGLLATGRFRTGESIAWVLVVMRYAQTGLAVVHLRRGRLHLVR